MAMTIPIIKLAAWIDVETTWEIMERSVEAGKKYERKIKESGFQQVNHYTITKEQLDKWTDE